MDLRDERRSVALEKGRDPRHRRDEVARKLGVLSLSNDDEERDAVPYHGGQLVGLVADAGIAAQRYPAALADGAQPFFVGAVGRKVIAVPFDREPTCREDVWEGVAEVAIGEENEAQAARS